MLDTSFAGGSAREIRWRSTAEVRNIYQICSCRKYIPSVSFQVKFDRTPHHESPSIKQPFRPPIYTLHL